MARFPDHACATKMRAEMHADNLNGLEKTHTINSY